MACEALNHRSDILEFFIFTNLSTNIAQGSVVSEHSPNDECHNLIWVAVMETVLCIAVDTTIFDFMLLGEPDYCFVYF